jgi:hypothetical protein
MRNHSTYGVVRTVFAGAMALALLWAAASSSGQAASFASYPRAAPVAQDVDLCAALPAASADLRVDRGRTPEGLPYCSATYRDDQSKPWRALSVVKYARAEDARDAVFKLWQASSGLNGEPVWVPATAYGDYGFDVPARVVTGNDGKPLVIHGDFIKFARGCYVVTGDVGLPQTGQPAKPPAALRAQAATTDQKLQTYPCAGSGAIATPTPEDKEPGVPLRKDVIRIVRTTDPPCETGGNIHAFVDEVRLGPGHDPDKVFIEMDDQGNIFNPEDPYFGGQYVELGPGDAVITPEYDPRDPSTLVHVTVKVTGTAYLHLESATIFTVPGCNFEGDYYLTPAERKLGKMELIIRFLNGDLRFQQIVRTKDAIGGSKERPGREGFSANSMAQPAPGDPIPNPDIRFIVDDSSGTGTKFVALYGSLQITPTNPSLKPFTLPAGRQVEVGPSSISPITPYASIPGSDSVAFRQTGHTVTGLFLQYWQTHGGLAQQGYPISDVMREVSDLNGQEYTVQYFERAVFEFHPEYSPPNDVLLSQLGTFQYKRKYTNGAPAQRANQQSGRFFPETGHWVGGRFWKYWQEHGGLAQQGLPLSDEFTEISETDGNPYLVQYFERAVFEFHPEYAPPNDVLLSLLGVFFYNQKYGATPPATPGPPRPTPTTGGQPPASCANLATASSGASIAAASSDYGSGYQPSNLIDDNPASGWSTAQGQKANQYVIIALPRGGTYNVNRVRLNPYTTSGNTEAYKIDSVKDFQVRVSTTDANPNSFRTVFNATAPMQDVLLEYTFQPVQAKYVMLFVATNYGGEFVEAKQFEVYEVCGTAPPSTIAPPPPTATVA